MKKLLFILFFLPLFAIGQTGQLELPYPIKLVVPKPLDYFYYESDGTPYDSTTEVTTQVLSAVRYQGQTFNVAGVEYWFKDGIADEDLVVKLAGGTTYTAGNGLTLTGSEFGLGGTLSEAETTIDLDGNGFVFDGGLGYMEFKDVSYFTFTGVSAFQVNSGAYDITTPGNTNDYISLVNDGTSLEVLTNTIRLFTGTISWGISDGTDVYPKFWADGFDTGTATNVLYHDPDTGEITTAAAPSGGVSDGDKGDITVSSSGSVWTIDNDSVTYAKLQNVAANSFLANVTGSAADVQEISTTRIPLFSSAITGTADNTTYLRGDGTWATPSGGGGITNDAANNELVKSDGTNVTGTQIYSTVDGSLILGHAGSPVTTRHLTTFGAENFVVSGFNVSVVGGSINEDDGGSIFITTGVGDVNDGDIVIDVNDGDLILEQEPPNNNALTQVLVRDGDTGVIHYRSASSLTAAAAQRSGTSIAFDTPATYGYSSAETGNITLNSTGLVEGVTQLLIHNHSSDPTFGSEFKIISGEYVTNEDNYIMLMAVKSNLILVTISQEQ